MSEQSQKLHQNDSASAGMVETDIKLVKEKVRTMVIATREMHGEIMDPEHVALPWCVRFRWSDHSPYYEGRRWTPCL